MPEWEDKTQGAWKILLISSLRTNGLSAQATYKCVLHKMYIMRKTCRIFTYYIFQIRWAVLNCLAVCPVTRLQGCYFLSIKMVQSPCCLWMNLVKLRQKWLTTALICCWATVCYACAPAHLHVPEWLEAVSTYRGRGTEHLRVSKHDDGVAASPLFSFTSPVPASGGSSIGVTGLALCRWAGADLPQPILLLRGHFVVSIWCTETTQWFGIWIIVSVL